MNHYIFKFIYVIAIRDAVGQQAYKASKGEKEWFWSKIPSWFEDKKATNHKETEAIFTEIEKFIDLILKDLFVDQVDYDSKFFDLCNLVIKNYNSIEIDLSLPKQFSLGHAQKLINMMIKYFYITTYSVSTTKTVPASYFRFCHCPMDYKLIKKVNKNLSRGKKIKYGWSSTTKANYENFQRTVEKQASLVPKTKLEYDYIVW